MSPGKLGDLLVGEGIINKEQLKQALDHQSKTRSRLGTALIQLGHVNEKVLATFLSKQYGITAISLDGIVVPSELTKLIPENICVRHTLVPVSIEANRLNVAVADPTNVSAVDDVRFLSNMDVNVYIAAESAIKSLIEKTYGGGEAGLADIMSESEEDGTSSDLEVAKEEVVDNTIDRDAANEKPVIRLINKLFVEAVRKKVSDIHIEPFETFSRIRFRIDGALHEVMRTPPQLKVAIPARLKVMAQMDISEKRLPQDGRLQVKMKDRKIDIRVSSLPTIFGEKIVMRLLSQGDSKPDLAKMGFEEDQLAMVRKAASQPYGMILVTGPTGSGKSTSLYAVLGELNGPDVNISTVEDPVEYNMAGVNQVQMKEGIGLNFAAALKSLLRQDPDVIMVGEIRDHETAEIAIKAALTGHLVLSTLHTNDAPSTITRLIHMGVEPFLITAALTLVQAQRLVRSLCQNCAEDDPKVTSEMLVAAEMPESWLESFTPKRGRGCDQCGGTGFKGRKGIYEVMMLTEQIREMVIKGNTSDEIKRTAMEAGMTTLRQSGLIKLYRGETTLEEVLNNSRPDGDLGK